MKIIKATFYLFIVMFLSYCSKTKINNDAKTDTRTQIIINDESFDEFKIKFFKDSVFQYSRISFPLRGMSTDLVFDEENAKDTIGENFKIKDGKFFWTSEKWSFINDKNLNSNDFSKEVSQKDNTVEIKYKSKVDDIVVFFIFHSDKERKWMLTYYSFEWN